jgi:hypothetical protein
MITGNLSARHLFNTSGSGKTRLALEGLCHNWGFYISCRSSDAVTSGSSDFEEAISMMQTISTWDSQPTINHGFHRNATTADRVFQMLLCARFFVLKKFVESIPDKTKVTDARRRWVLLQATPPVQRFRNDIFVEILRNLRSADTNDLRNIAAKMFSEIIAEREDLFPDGARLFAVLDEAQEAAKHLVDYFPSTTSESSTLHSVLHDVYRFLHNSTLFAGIIVSGTGLSLETVKESLSSIAGKPMTSRRETTVITGTGAFPNEAEQEKYIRRYLTLSDGNVSDKRLLERIKQWCMGRCVCPLIYLIYCSYFEYVFQIVIGLPPVSSSSIYTHQIPHAIAFLLNSLSN